MNAFPSSSRLSRLIAALLLPVFLLFLAAGFTPDASAAAQDGKGKKGKKSRPDPGADLFTNGPVLRLNIEIAPPQMQSLRADKRRFVRAKLTETTGGVTNVYPDIAIHVKGMAGSGREIDQDPALTINFDKYSPDQKFHGLDKIHLNNSVQDPSFSNELLCGDLMDAAGVPAARVTHALVRLNVGPPRFYVLKEGFGKEMLGRYFKKTKGNLYDGGFLQEVDTPLERDMGDNPPNHADLKALVAAANQTNLTTRWEQLSKVLDVERFANYLAIEILTEDWDGYPRNRNNYRIYHDPETDKLVFIPHGMDQMFRQENTQFKSPPLQGLIAVRFHETPEGMQLYRSRVRSLFTNLFQYAVLTNKLETQRLRNRPALLEIHPNAARDYDSQIADVRNRIQFRIRNIEKQLGPPVPPPTFVSGVAMLKGWKPAEERRLETNSAKLARVPDAEGRETLSIAATGLTNTTASWRTSVTLDAGKYRFEGLARTVGVMPIVRLTTNALTKQEVVALDKKGLGAGLRISMSPTTRTNQVVGDQAWTRLFDDFVVTRPETEIELVCELRASAGQVWYDEKSLKLLRLP